MTVHYDFYHWCAHADLDELNTLASTVETWWPAIEAFIDTGITNARTEGINLFCVWLSPDPPLA